MSMQYYNFSEIGFVADLELQNFIKQQYLQELLGEDCDENSTVQDVDFETFREFMDDQGFSYDGDLEYCRLSPVTTKDIEWWSGYEYYDSVYCYQLDKFPKLFSAVYSSLEEIITEIKNKIGHLLPTDYDIGSHIFYVEGTYYG